jgi:hypothetical protein
MNLSSPRLEFGRIEIAYHAGAGPAPVSVAIAADALINAVVLLFDPAVEVRGGRALGRAWMIYPLSR